MKERNAIYESLALQVREKFPEKVIPEVFGKGEVPGRWNHMTVILWQEEARRGQGTKEDQYG